MQKSFYTTIERRIRMKDKKKQETKNDKDKRLLSTLSPTFIETLKSLWKNAINYIQDYGWIDPEAPDYIYPDMYSLAHQYYRYLRVVDTSEWNEKEQEIWRMFLDCQPAIIRRRRRLRASLDVAEKLNMLNLNIGIWAIYEWFPSSNLGFSYIMNVKGLISDYTKCLLKCVEQVVDGDGVTATPVMHDRIRGRIVLENSKGDSAELLTKIAQLYVNILTNPFSKEFQMFKKWVETDTHQYGGCEIPKERILKLLSDIEEENLNLVETKNYISKNAGHSAYHIILSYLSDSTGLMHTEIQILDRITSARDAGVCYTGEFCSDHQKIPNKQQAHDAYKEFRNAWAKEIFVEELKNVRFYGFVSDEEGNINDDVGIVKDRPFGKRFADKHSIPKN